MDRDSFTLDGVDRDNFTFDGVDRDSFTLDGVDRDSFTLDGVDRDNFTFHTFHSVAVPHCEVLTTSLNKHQNKPPCRYTCS